MAGVESGGTADAHTLLYRKTFVPAGAGSPSRGPLHYVSPQTGRKKQQMARRHGKKADGFAYPTAYQGRMASLRGMNTKALRRRLDHGKWNATSKRAAVAIIVARKGV